jgi:hypothetical protein
MLTDAELLALADVPRDPDDLNPITWGALAPDFATEPISWREVFEVWEVLP